MNSSVNEEHVVNNILAVNLKLLKLLGLWQGHTASFKFSWAIKLFIFYRWALLIIMYLHTATEYLDIVFTWGDLENLAATGSVTLIYTTCIMKQTVFLLFEKRLQDLVHSLRSGNLATSLRWTKQHFEILHIADRRAQAASWRYYYLCIGTIISFFITSIISSYGTAFGLEGFSQGNQTVKTLVFKAWFPFDIQQSGYFEIAFCFQIITCTMGPAINVGMDTLLVSVIINCCGEFRVLKYSLRTIRERAEELLASEKSFREENLSVSEMIQSKENVRTEQAGVLTGR
ncbi:uncharacterized protein LOC110837397 [Zootermopsis nevadensis]|uniref:uncharacterized protein LOC110837396 n=1 Tax=Zootermopsis nevadensis TaxID=136037 RepID=UPI000B8EBE5E|nr:uncharacterized protein LOC110837396 [Zootermopsis nevadensis]XP_021935177.1 uncharacterized protein LOC110837397 [Zootermopsis nevadensis]